MKKICFNLIFKDLRIIKGLRQSDLAKTFSVTQPTIARWEDGSVQPDFAMLISIAEFFEVTTDYLLGLEN